MPFRFDGEPMLYWLDVACELFPAESHFLF